jgi:predicted HTH transcriptional regulator
MAPNSSLNARHEPEGRLMVLERDRLPTDEELLGLVSNGEDQTTERKAQRQTKHTLRTLIAFANSTPVGYPAVLFIGVADDGQIEGMSDSELDSAQKNLRREAENAYPPIPYFPRIVNGPTGKFLAVVVPGSPDRPHFAGASYIRQGSESVEASSSQFQALLAERSSKVYEIRKWIGKDISFSTPSQGTGGSHTGKIIDCNSVLRDH